MRSAGCMASIPSVREISKKVGGGLNYCWQAAGMRSELILDSSRASGLIAESGASFSFSLNVLQFRCLVFTLFRWKNGQQTLIYRLHLLEDLSSPKRGGTEPNRDPTDRLWRESFEQLAHFAGRSSCALVTTSRFRRKIGLSISRLQEH